MYKSEKRFYAKFYLVEICTGVITGLLVLSCLTPGKVELQKLHNTLYLSCATTAAVGFLLYESERKYIEAAGKILTKIGLNLFGFLLVVFK